MLTDDWDYACLVLAHSLSDVTVHGYVGKKMYPKYINAISWANQWSEKPAITYSWEHVKSNRNDLNYKIVTMKDVDCLTQGIFTAIFAIHGMQDFFTLEKTDYELLDPILKHLEKLVPWFRFQS